jgi:hypothetical protein
MKFGRDYVLTVGVGPFGPPVQTGGATGGVSYATNQVEIKPPLTLEFDIRREFMASAQTATLRIKNLKEKTRDIIYKDRFSTTLYAPIKLQAGYEGSPLSTIFEGSIWFASSYRYDRRNIVTEIESFDGGFAYGNSFTSICLPPSHSFRDALTRLNGDLVGVYATPIIGTVPATLGPRSTVLVGPTFNLLTKLLPASVAATIDNNQLKVLADTDVIQFGPDVFEISVDSGLLDPPVREGAMLNCRMLFEPRIQLGQVVRLRSVVNSIFNGNFQVRGVSHYGIISDSEGGPAYTTLNLYLGPGFLKTLSGAISSPT